jgi:hypothetical protein
MTTILAVSLERTSLVNVIFSDLVQNVPFLSIVCVWIAKSGIGMNHVDCLECVFGIEIARADGLSAK